MNRVFWALAASALVLLACGCRPAFNPPPRPAQISHMDVATKLTRIDNVASTLKIFLDTGRDLRSRAKRQELRRLTAEADRYIELQVRPIIHDFEASANLTTRLEIAKLQLLTGLVYLELDNQEWKLYQWLSAMEHRYADQPDVLNATIDRTVFGYDTIAAGLRGLEERRFR